MTGLGTIVNVAAIIIGGLLGHTSGRLLTEHLQETLLKTLAVATLFIGISSTLTQMLSVGEDGHLAAAGILMMIICLALGAIVGETLKIEERMEGFGGWLREKTHSTGDTRFIDGFITASVTFCAGAMSVLGAIQDSMLGDYNILFAKSLLDMIFCMILTASLGKGVIFSAISVGVFQGTITLFAALLAPYMTDAALSNIGYVGGVMIFCVGLNLLLNLKIRVANLLPALIFAAIAAFL